jgi:hypothetical protein
VAIENLCSFMLWQHLPMAVMEGLDECFEETAESGFGPLTNWRLPTPSIGFISADPQLRKRYMR